MKNIENPIKGRISVIIFTFLLISFFISAQAQSIFKRQVILMGSVFELTVVSSDQKTADKYMDLAVEEILRIEDLISEWRPYTQISLVNQNAGIKPVKVDREVFDLTQRAITYSKMSNGAFDISIAALDKVWIFDGSMESEPSREKIKHSVKNVGYQFIVLDSLNSTIYLSRKGMKIGFGSIGKGYAADKGRELLKKSGVSAGIVNASGDISSWGRQPNGKPWLIGINNPFRPHHRLKKIRMKEAAVATSGSYEKFAEINGVRYSHIINPKTGYPSIGLTSVTIYGPETEFANALSTSIMVMGAKDGIKLLRQYPDYKGIFITDKGKTIK